MAEYSYDVVRHRGTWRVLHLGRHSPSHADQEAAIRAALKSARKKVSAGRDAEVRLNRTDGEIVVVPLTDADAANPDAMAADQTPDATGTTEPEVATSA